MNPGETLKSAWAGWSDIFLGKQSFSDHFDVSPEGLNAANLAYLVVAFALAALQMTLTGFASPAVAIFQFVSFLAPAASLYLVTHAARGLGVMDAETTRVLVPGLYMHTAVLVLSTLIALMGVNLAGAVLGITAYFLYRLGRIAGRMALGWAIGYAILNVVVLIGLTVALYMASTSLFSPA